MYEKQEWSDVYGETPFNADRMKHIEEGIYENSKKIVGTVLYENESGTNENLTFEEELQYEPKKIAIYYKDDDDTYSFTEIVNPIGKAIDLHILRINKSYNFRIRYSRAIFSKTGITINDSGRNDNGTLSNTNDIYITKIISYK